MLQTNTTRGIELLTQTSIGGYNSIEYIYIHLLIRKIWIPLFYTSQILPPDYWYYLVLFHRKLISCSVATSICSNADADEEYEITNLSTDKQSEYRYPVLVPVDLEECDDNSMRHTANRDAVITRTNYKHKYFDRPIYD